MRRPRAPAPETRGARWGGLSPIPVCTTDLGQVVAQGCEIVREVLGRGVAVLRLLRQAAVDDPAIRRRRRRRRGGQWIRVLAHDRGHRLGWRGLLKRPAAGGHLVEDRAEGELIGAVVDGARWPVRATCIRPCRGGSRSVPGAGPSVQAAPLPRAGELGQPEVQDLDVTFFGHHDVFGFQVPMHDPRGVCLREPSASWMAMSRAGGGHRPLRKRDLSDSPGDQLHRDGDGAAGADVVDRHDVGMVERRRRAGLLRESGEPFSRRRAPGSTLIATSRLRRWSRAR